MKYGERSRLGREVLDLINMNRNRKRERHGLSKTPIYHRWQQMLARCYNPNCPNYVRYGKRGITVCERWRGSVVAILSDLGQPPAGHSLERIDNNGGYWCGKCEECLANNRQPNCRWATRLEQGRNRRDNRFVEHGGERLTISALAARYGVDDAVLWRRLFVSKWPIERAITEPINSHAEAASRRDVDGLVIVFGASDDLMEFRGAICDEVGAWNGGTAYISDGELINETECDSECKYFLAARARAKTVDAVWDKEGYSWVIKTDIPHATFEIFEGTEPYCKGIVFEKHST